MLRGTKSVSSSGWRCLLTLTLAPGTPAEALLPPILTPTCHVLPSDVLSLSLPGQQGQVRSLLYEYDS